MDWPQDGVKPVQQTQVPQIQTKDEPDRDRHGWHNLMQEYSSLSGRITNMETILSRVSIQLQNLAQHMMYTEYVKRLREIQFDAKNSLTTI